MEADEYRKLAEVEDRMWYFRTLHARLDHAIVPHLQKLDTPRVLDAGCGTGGLLHNLQRRHPRWRLEGIDLSPLAVEETQRRGLPVVQGSLTALPYPEKHFDAVTCGDVLYHLEKPAEGLAELARVLRPGGILALNVPAYRWLWSYHDTRTGAHWRFVRSEIKSLLEGSGLRPERITYWNTLPFPLIVARRKLFPPRSGESDVQVFPWPLERAFDFAMALERGWTHFATLPFGSSLFAVGTRPGD